MTISTISTTINNGVNLGNGTYATNLTITNTGAITPASGYAIYASSSLGSFNIINQGILATTGQDVIQGGSTGTLINSGTIINSDEIAGEVGISFGLGGTIINSGTISGFNALGDIGGTAYIENSGLITGGGRGLVLDGSANYFNNLGGTITSNIGVFAIQTATGSNSGTILGTLDGIYLISGGSLLNSGTIGSASFAIDNQSGAFTLAAATGAVFQGNVFDKPGTGILNLAGTTAGSLAMGGTFTGFSSIAFGAAPWALEGTTAELAAGQTISGFTEGDTLIAAGFAAHNATYVNGTGLILSNNNASETIGLNALPSGEQFLITESGILSGSSPVVTISAGTPPASTISTISTAAYTYITPGASSFNNAITITQTGTISASTGHYSVYSSYFDGPGTITNFGVITAAGTSVNIAVGLGFGGEVANYGVISNNYGAAVWGLNNTSLVNQGTILAATRAVNVEDGSGSIINNGLISGTDGVIFSATTQESLDNTGTIIGTSVGVEQVSAPLGTFINSGLIIGGAEGLLLVDAADVTNAGTLMATIANDYALVGENTLLLTVEAGATFIGKVRDTSSRGTLNLAGTTAGSLNIGSSFSGFNQISFSSNDWTLGGTTADLASGQTISGFTLGDSIELENIAASTSTFANGTLTLFNGSGTSLASLDIIAPANTQFLVSNDGTNSFLSEQQALCFLAGTRILTPAGEKPIEALNIGDEIVTRFGGVQKIKWLGRQSYAPHFIASNPDKWPVRITQGALDGILPRRDLLLSPGHSMLIGDHLILARNLVNGITIRQEQPTQTIDYINIEFSHHDCVQTESAWSETYADAPGMRAQFHNAADFYALYPDHVPVRGLTLCAPRPQAGPDLETALRPIVEAATARITLGALDGYIDILTSDRISGWARDTAHPHLPVLLDIVLDHEVIATILACDPRGDLAKAGLGNCAFAVSLTEPLTESELAALTIHRHGTALSIPNSLPKAA